MGISVLKAVIVAAYVLIGLASLLMASSAEFVWHPSQYDISAYLLTVLSMIVSGLMFSFLMFYLALYQSMQAKPDGVVLVSALALGLIIFFANIFHLRPFLQGVLTLVFMYASYRLILKVNGKKNRKK